MRYSTEETTDLLQIFETGDTVTISLYDLSDDSAVTLTSNTCSEIGSTGVFKWNTSNITTYPIEKTEYLWVMNNGVENKFGKLIIGGYIDDLIQLWIDTPDRSYERFKQFLLSNKNLIKQLSQ